MTEIPSDTTIQAKSSTIGTGNRMRRRRVASTQKTRFEHYFTVRIKHYILDGAPAMLLTFVGLNHEIDVEISGAARDALIPVSNP